MRPRPRLNVYKKQQHLAEKHGGLPKSMGDDMERILDECKLRLKRQKESAQKKQALTKDQLAHVREAKRQEHDSFEARITYLETLITDMERKHTRDIKGMAGEAQANEAAAQANAAKGRSLLQQAHKRAELWKTKALEAEARAQKAEEQAARLEVEVDKFREKQDADKRKVSCPFRPCRFVSSTDGAETCA